MGITKIILKHVVFSCTGHISFPPENALPYYVSQCVCSIHTYKARKEGEKHQLAS